MKRVCNAAETESKKEKIKQNAHREDLKGP